MKGTKNHYLDTYFGWTIICIATYLVVVTITMVYQQDIDVELPDIPGTPVFLWG